MAKLKQKTLPSFLQPFLWSYKVENLNPETDKRYIITQILNYGDKEALRWLFSTYSEEEIKKIIANPRQGMWLDEVLNFWTKIYNINLDKETYQKAIFEPSKIPERHLKPAK